MLLGMHSASEQVVSLRSLLCDRQQILGQQMALLHQRLGGLLHPAQVVLPGSIALLDRETWVADGLAFCPRRWEGNGRAEQCQSLPGPAEIRVAHVPPGVCR